jgi:N-methylhydantoinase A
LWSTVGFASDDYRSGTKGSIVYRLGLDIGGTFSDLTVYDAGAESFLEFKSLTTYDSVDSVARCLTKAADAHGRTLEEFLADVELFTFGSTHALNTLLTETGSPVGIVTTKGHRDVYHIAEMERGGHLDVREAVEKAFVPLIPRRRILEVPERHDATGKVVVPLDEQAAADAVRRLVEDEGAEAIVVSFLWAHRWPDHERRVGEIAREHYPDLHVTLGSEISGTLGEFNRLATAVINGYVGKSVDQQAGALRDFLVPRGLSVPILVMQLVGGVAPLAEVVRRPVTLLKSGPAGGAVAAASIADAIGEPNVVCIDMGGTSLDVSRIVDGEIELNRGFTVRGHPVSVPGVEVESIGAGGGSIAVLESAGGVARLRVGPESAGSKPGPVCYGRGGQDPTVTDANLVLGILDANVELGGEIALDLEGAKAALRERVAGPLGQSEEEAAWGVYRVVTAQMADAVENSLISNGVDPRNFALMAFGAAAPAHATAIASRLGIESVIIPSFFPVFSAYGLMTTDIRHVYDLTDDSVRVPVDLDADKELDAKADYAAAKLRSVMAMPLELLENEGIAAEDRDVSLFIDLRYSGQELQMSIEVPRTAVDEPWSGAALRGVIEAWQDKYLRVYGESAVWHEGTIEVVNYRAVGIGRIPSPALTPGVDADTGADEAIPAHGTRRIYLGDWIDADVYRASELVPGWSAVGPAVIEGELTTILVGIDETVSAGRFGELRITVNREAWHGARPQVVAAGGAA